MELENLYRSTVRFLLLASKGHGNFSPAMIAIRQRIEALHAWAGANGRGNEAYDAWRDACVYASKNGY